MRLKGIIHCLLSLPCDGGGALLVRALAAEADEQLAHVLHVLQLPQLRERVVTKGLVQRGVAVLGGGDRVGVACGEAIHRNGLLALRVIVRTYVHA